MALAPVWASICPILTTSCAWAPATHAAVSTTAVAIFAITRIVQFLPGFIVIEAVAWWLLRLHHSSRGLARLLRPILLLLQSEDRGVASGPVGRQQAGPWIVIGPAGRLAAHDRSIVLRLQRIVGVGHGIR